MKKAKGETDSGPRVKSRVSDTTQRVHRICSVIFRPAGKGRKSKMPKMEGKLFKNSEDLQDLHKL